jgi:hypothetical protein
MAAPSATGKRESPAVAKNCDGRATQAQSRFTAISASGAAVPPGER